MVLCSWCLRSLLSMSPYAVLWLVFPDSNCGLCSGDLVFVLRDKYPCTTTHAAFNLLLSPVHFFVPSTANSSSQAQLSSTTVLRATGW